MSDKTHRIVLILITGLSFGSSIVLTRLGLGKVPPLHLVMVRLLIATVLFIPALIITRSPLPRDWRTWRDIAFAGLIGTGIAIALGTLALNYMSSGVFTIFIALNPAVTGLMAHFMLADERLTPGKLAGLLVAFGGVVFLILTGSNGLASDGRFSLAGPLLVIASVLIGAYSLIYVRQRLPDADVMVLSAGQTAAAFLFLLPITLAAETLPLAEVGWRGWLAIGWNGVVAGFVGFLLLFALLKRHGATAAALTGYVVPVVSGLLGALVLADERITLPVIVGGGLTLAGVFVSSR